jgi:hypothetical protein
MKCDKCGHIYKGQNLFGKICVKCNAFIEPNGTLPIVKENQLKMMEAKQQLLEVLRKHYANSKR